MVKINPFVEAIKNAVESSKEEREELLSDPAMEWSNGSGISIVLNHTTDAIEKCTPEIIKIIKKFRIKLFDFFGKFGYRNAYPVDVSASIHAHQDTGLRWDHGINIKCTWTFISSDKTKIHSVEVYFMVKWYTSKGNPVPWASLVLKNDSNASINKIIYGKKISSSMKEMIDSFKILCDDVSLQILSKKKKYSFHDNLRCW